MLREQLLAAGLGRGAIAHRLKNGRLYPYYRGVYLVGRSSLDPFGREMAAILAFRGRAVVSHSSAAAAWRLVDAPGDKVTVSIVDADARSRPHLTVHRTTDLRRPDLRLRDGLPLTSPSRTLIDLAGGLTAPELEDALARAFMQGLTSEEELERALARAPLPKRRHDLRKLISAGADAGFTRSAAERRLRELLRAAGLPPPNVNARLHGFNVDFLWPEQRLVIEIDGYRFHRDREAFERDRRRDQVLVAAGYRVIRITWTQLRDEPFGVVARVAMALSSQ